MTNEEVAQMLGISNSMASRLRSGDRNPSVKLMTRIEEITGWKMSYQAKVHGTPEYAAQFERALREGHHTRAREEVAS